MGRHSRANAELNSVWLVANSCSETVINDFLFASIPPMCFDIAKSHTERPELLCEMLPRLFLDRLGSRTVLISRDQKAFKTSSALETIRFFKPGYKPNLYSMYGAP